MVEPVGPREAPLVDIAAVYPSYPDASDALVVNIVLNGEGKGDHFVYRSKHGEILLKVEDVKALGLDAPEQQSVFIGNERCLPLSSMTKSISAAFDERTLTLTLQASVISTSRRIIDMTPAPQRKRTYYPRETSAYLNYGINYVSTEPVRSRTTAISNELGIRSGDVLFRSDSVYARAGDKDELIRLMSTVTYERRQDMQWILAGDQIASSGALGSRVNLAGIGIEKVYHIDPYYIQEPMFSMSGLVTVPSQVEVFLDGVLVNKQRLQPGEFELANLNYYGGAHTVEVVLTDPYGTVQRLISPVYFADAFLRQGLHEYAYHLGLLREQYGSESNEYGPLAFSGFHRYGVSDAVNIGIRSEGADGLYNGGLEAGLIVPRAGSITVGASASTRREAKGAAGSLQHTYRWKSLFTSLSLRSFSRDYLTIGRTEASDPVKSETAAGIGSSLGTWGGLSLGYSRQELYSGADRGTTTATYTRSLSRSSSVFITGRAERERVTEYSVFVGYRYTPDRDHQVTANYQRSEAGAVASVQYQKNQPVGEGLGYHVLAQRQELDEGTKNVLSPAVRYNARYGVYSAEASVGNGSGGPTARSTSLSAAGSLVYAGGFFGFSRPVEDSFAIVLAQGLEGASVQMNGNAITTIGPDGTAIVPTLAPYGDNRVSLDPGSVPVDISLAGPAGNLSPSLGGAACVSYDAARVRAVIGRLVTLREGQQVPVESYEVTMQVGDRTMLFLTGRDGEFYFENRLPYTLTPGGPDPRSCQAAAERRRSGGDIIKPDIYDAWVTIEGQRCSFRITVPISDDIMTDIGTVPCLLAPARI